MRELHQRVDRRVADAALDLADHPDADAGQIAQRLQRQLALAAEFPDLPADRAQQMRVRCGARLSAAAPRRTSDHRLAPGFAIVEDFRYSEDSQADRPRIAMMLRPGKGFT